MGLHPAGWKTRRGLSFLSKYIKFFASVYVPFLLEVHVPRLAQASAVRNLKRDLYIYFMSRKYKFHDNDYRSATDFFGMKGLIELNYSWLYGRSRTLAPTKGK
jgi:hypothetical protein